VEGSSAGTAPRQGGATDDTIVLCYHALSEDWRAPLSVTPQQFEFQIGLLASRGYRGATFTEAALAERPEKVVAVTFDDGYRSVIDLARPILDRHGFPGTVFVPTRFMDTGKPLAWDGVDEWLGGPHENELLPMSWAQLRSLTDGGWEIGSHTLTHPRLPAIDDAELRAQLLESRQECARMIGGECTSIAFPYGDADARVLREAEAAGYSAAAMLSDRLDRSSRFACPRIGVYQVDSHRAFRLKVSPTVRRLRRSRAWLPIARLLHSIRRG
jgi:peptidoglycan/xylan/chitin deacetylase (PgdA/CDA1 family)